MGALEKIDWDKLGGELYSVIAHASAGTDFCSSDLQMAVDGCVEEVKRALKAVEENGSSYNKQNTPCSCTRDSKGNITSICYECAVRNIA